jgi:hypothetical protein
MLYFARTGDGDARKTVCYHERCLELNDRKTSLTSTACDTINKDKTQNVVFSDNYFLFPNVVKMLAVKLMDCRIFRLRRYTLRRSRPFAPSEDDRKASHYFHA